MTPSQPQGAVTVMSKGSSLFWGMITSKTFWFNVAAVFLAVLELKEVINIIPVGWMPFVTAAVGAVNVALRMFTKAPITGSPGHSNAKG